MRLLERKRRLGTSPVAECRTLNCVSPVYTRESCERKPAEPPMARRRLQTPLAQAAWPSASPQSPFLALSGPHTVTQEWSASDPKRTRGPRVRAPSELIRRKVETLRQPVAEPRTWGSLFSLYSQEHGQKGFFTETKSLSFRQHKPPLQRWMPIQASGARRQPRIYP